MVTNDHGGHFANTAAHQLRGDRFAGGARRFSVVGKPSCCESSGLPQSETQQWCRAAECSSHLLNNAFAASTLVGASK